VRIGRGVVVVSTVLWIVTGETTRVGAQSQVSPEQVIAASVFPLPEQLRAGAGVVAFDPQHRRVELRRSTNGMVCMRPVPGEDVWDSRCYQQTFVRLIFRAGDLMRRGQKPADVDAQFAREIKRGTLKLPASPTAGYRMLGPADAYDPETGTATPALEVWQSIHMPYRTAAELGLPDESALRPGQESRGPFMMAGGTWWAHAMILHSQSHDAKPLSQ
jgi:hypothetical protein